MGYEKISRRACVRPTALAVAMLLASGPAWAHDYWFERDAEDYLLFRGHRYSEHTGAEVVPYDPEIVRRTVCVEPTGSRREADSVATYPARIAGPCSAVLVRADSGYWSQTLTGTKNQPRDELFGVLRSWQAFESVKLLERWQNDLAAPLTDGLELVCETDPFTLRPGRKLRLLVVQQRKPRAGVTVAYDGSARGATGEDGRINLRVRHGGLQRITASVEEPVADGRADKLVRSTALFFTLPGEE